MATSQKAKCLSILGTGSDVGKSIVVTALCRIFSNAGINVAPFKAQNMSNNSFVTPLGGEMGRAQVVQAEAARAPLHVNMNPVLLKPGSDTGSQVILQGKTIGNADAINYFSNTSHLKQKALESLNQLRDQYDLIIMEGAGSCAEVNLREKDFVNFEMAHAVDAPVILVADIDRGGVFAQIIGTLNILPDRDRDRVKGIIINRFRGDPGLFKDGLSYIEKETALPVLGLIPFYRHIQIEAEDGLPLDVSVDSPLPLHPKDINIAVIRLPHISNFTDFDSLSHDPAVSLRYVSKQKSLHEFDCVILPGSKNVRFDCDWLKQEGWDQRLNEYIEQKGRMVGICGGYQMLGTLIQDPHGVEGHPGNTQGLGYLNIKTILQPIKVLARSWGFWGQEKIPVSGYEIHMGQTEVGPELKHAIYKENGADGVIACDGRIWGTYFHGAFDSPDFRTHFLRTLRSSYKPPPNQFSKDHQYDLLAEHFKKYLSVSKLERIVGKDRIICHESH